MPSQILKEPTQSNFLVAKTGIGIITGDAILDRVSSLHHLEAKCVKRQALLELTSLQEST